MNIIASVQQMPLQTLAVTPQLIQSVQVLQFNSQELSDYVKEQSERNPLIRISPDSATVTSAVSGTETGEGRRINNREATGKEGGPTYHARLDSRQTSSSARAPNLEAFCAIRTSLRESLRSQFMIEIREPRDIRIGIEIIDSIEEDGYFRRDITEMSWLLEVSEDDIVRVLETIQTFEPAGVGARNLSECLKIQLREANKLTPLFAIFLDHLPLLAAYRIPELARVCRVEPDVILKLAADVRKLNPRPGAQFDNEPILSAIPDVIVKEKSNGDFTVELNPRSLPKVLLDRDYFAEVSVQAKGKETKKFVTDCWNNANWLVRNLEQRAQTILRVATEVLTRQRDFLRYGPGHLHPLNLKDVATALNIHESTVSRATVNKYVNTSRGTFELKSFFVNSIATSDGTAFFSSEKIRQRVKELIDGETSATIQSDDAIMNRLKREGIEIARRTVAKYRDELNIPSSTDRRRQRVMSETAYVNGSGQRAIA
ncbi:RNA polymerase factor sigma-54 [Falsochrobactrum shanghaiense]|nr:RNA polymerase factor sigma-54 [Falsochrobactrum shanghaiense]